MLKLDGSDASAAERAALEWFSTTNKGDVVTSLDNLNNYSVLWIMIDRVGRNQKQYPAPLYGNIQKLNTWVKNGGNLIVTNQATDLVSEIGRVANFAPTIYGNGSGGNNPDDWGINAVTATAKAHAIYEGLDKGQFRGNEYFPLIGGGNKWDHNSMWELSRLGYSGQGDFERRTLSVCLGTWQQNTDLNIPALIEFKPTGEYKGTVLANGIAAFDWQAPQKDNLKKLAANMIAYMLGKPAVTEPTEPEQPAVPDTPVGVGDKVGMLKIENGLSDTEKNAI